MGPTTYTCRQVHEEYMKYATAIAARFRAGDRVLLLLPPGSDYVMSFLGCLAAGVIAVPLLPPNSKKNFDRVIRVAKDASAACVLTDETTMKIVGDRNFKSGTQCDVLSLEALLQGQSGRDESLICDRSYLIDSASTAFLQYTSGSTGDPKGVIVCHGNISSNSLLIQSIFGHSEKSHMVSWLPPHHDMGLIGGIIQPLYVGFEATLMKPITFLKNPFRWLESISKFGGTTSGAPNFAYELCVNRIGQEKLEQLDLSSWKIAFNGSEPINPMTMERFLNRFSACGFKRSSIFPCYGLAEATLLVSGKGLEGEYEVKSFDVGRLASGVAEEQVDQHSNVKSLVACGSKHDDIEILIVKNVGSSENQIHTEARKGEVGEIWVAGGGNGKGYWNRPGLTEEVFNANLPGYPQKFLRTGDLGFFCGSQLFISGRIKDIFIINGANIYPQDLEAIASQVLGENALNNGFAAFSRDEREAIVLIGETRLRDPAQLAEWAKDIRRRISIELDLRVDSIEFFPPGSIAKTTSGKVQRRACKARWMEGAIKSLYPSSDAKPVVRRPEDLGEIQSLTNVILSRLSQLTEIRTGLDPSMHLADIGLDSISTIQLLADLEKKYDIVLDQRLLKESQTIHDLSEHIAQIINSAKRRPEQKTDTEKFAGVSVFEEPLIFESKRKNGNPYHLSAAFLLERNCDLNAIILEIRQLFERFPAWTARRKSSAECVTLEPVNDLEGIFNHFDLVSAGHSRDEKNTVLRNSLYAEFDLEGESPVRVNYGAYDDKWNYVGISFHHAVLDYSSALSFVQWLTGEEFPDVPQYESFTRWQKNYLASAVHEKDITYWRSQLKGFDPHIDFLLPERGQAFYKKKKSSLTMDIGAAALQYSATFNNIALTAYAQCLSAVSGQDEIIIGIPAMAHGENRFFGTPGCFVNPLILRLRLTGKWEADLRHVSRVVDEATTHSNAPLSHIMDELKKVGAGVNNTPFETMFLFQRPTCSAGKILCSLITQEDYESIPIRGYKGISIPMPNDAGILPISCNCIYANGKIHITVEYDAQRVSEEAASAIHRLLHDSFKEMVSGQLTNVSEACLRLDVPLSVNCTKADSPEVNFLEVLVQRFIRDKSKIAIRHGLDSWTYGELERMSGFISERVVAMAGAFGVQSIAFPLLPQGMMHIAAFIGILRAGHIPVLWDKGHFPVGRLAEVLNQLENPILIFQNRSDDNLEVENGARIYLDDLFDGLGTPSDLGIARSELTRKRNNGKYAYLSYTSGTSGVPKASLISWSALNNHIANVIDHFAMEGEDIVLQFASPAFDVFLEECLPALASGSQLVVYSSRSFFDIKAMHEDIKRHRVNMVNLPTSAWRAYCAYCAEQECGIPGTLQKVIVGSEPIYPSEVEEWGRMLEPSAKLWGGYGPSECCITASLLNLQSELDKRFSDPPIGRPMGGVSYYVLNAHLEPVPAGVPGELFIGGQCISDGYLGSPGKSASSYFPDPFSGIPGTRMYKTGDRARMNHDGSFYFLGRVDFQAKINGIRFEPGEVDSYLMGFQPIKESITWFHESEGRSQLMTAVVSDSAKPEEVRAFLKDKLPRQFMPGVIKVFAKFPRLVSSKIDMSALKNLAMQNESSKAAAKIATQNRSNRSLEAIFRSVLGEGNPFEVDRNFFELGFNSLSLSRLHGLVEKSLDVKIPIAQLYEFPTFNGFLASIDPVSKQTQLAFTQRVPKGASAQNHSTAVAVIGTAFHIPGASDLDELGKLLMEGKSGIKEFSEDELLSAGVQPELLKDENYVRKFGWIENIDRFDHRFFQYSAREAQMMDPQHRLLLQASWRALEDAGLAGQDSESIGKVGVFASCGYNLYQARITPEMAKVYGDYNVQIANDKDFLASRIAYKLGCRGPAVTIQTACSSSLVSLNYAVNSLRKGECDYALVGASSLLSLEKQGYLFQKDNIASPIGKCLPFDSKACGTVPANGVAVVVLCLKETAENGGYSIHGLIEGSAVNNDGIEKAGYTAPSVKGQRQAIEDALKDAGLDPSQVSYVETHGTGTITGDPIEWQALTQTYGRGTDAGPCFLGAVKSVVGHLDTVSGLVGVLKVLAMFRQRRFFRNHYFEKLSPLIVDPDSRLKMDIPPDLDMDGVFAGVSSFGIGGTNAHVILKDPGKPEALENTLVGVAANIIPVSARTGGSLETQKLELEKYLGDATPAEFAEISARFVSGRKKFREARGYFYRKNGKIAWNQKLNHQGSPKTIFYFPGQGLSLSGLDTRILVENNELGAFIRENCQFVQSSIGHELAPYFYGELDLANLHRSSLTTQLFLFIHEASVAEWLMAQGVKPAMVFGHSFGEYISAMIAGIFTKVDTLKLIEKRGQILDRFEGEMAAIFMPRDELLLELPTELSHSAENGSELNIIAGPADAMSAYLKKLDKRAIVNKKLPVSHPFHSKELNIYREEFQTAVAEANPRMPTIPMITNTTGSFADGSILSPEQWGNHLVNAVEFRKSLSLLGVEAGNLVVIECGPYSGLAKSLQREVPEKNIPVVSMAAFDSENPMDGFKAEIWLNGVDVAFHGKPNKKLSKILPTYSFEQDIHWIDGNEHRVPGGLDFTANAAEPRLRTMGWKQVEFNFELDSKSTQGRILFLAPKECDLFDCLGKSLVKTGRKIDQVDFSWPNHSHFDNPDTSWLKSMSDSGENVDAILVALSSQQDHTSLSAMEAEFGEMSKLWQLFCKKVLDLQIGIPIHVIVWDTAQMSPSETLSPSMNAMLSLIRVTIQESPELKINISDVCYRKREWRPAEVDNLLYFDRGSPYRALRGSAAFVPMLKCHIKKTAPLVQYPKGARYMVTGGAGEIGLTLIESIASFNPAEFVIVGRRTREELSTSVNDRMELLRDVGHKIDYLAVDITDPDDLAKLQGMKVSGLIHAAGAFDFRLSSEIQDILLTTDWKAKVTGIIGLLEIVEVADFMVFCSSLRAWEGGVGCGSYAAASAFLDGIANWIAEKYSLRSVSLNWDSWVSGGMGVAEVGRGASQTRVQMAGFDRESGRKLFQEALSFSPHDQVACIASDFPDDISQLLVPKIHDASKSASSQPSSIIASGDSHGIVREIWKHTLGCVVSDETDFFASGGDSILALQLVKNCRSQGIETSVQQIINYPKFMEFAHQLDRTEKFDFSGRVRLSPIQLWMRGAAGDKLRNWVQSIGLKSKIPLDLAKLNILIKELLQRHPYLYARFDFDSGEAIVENGVGPRFVLYERRPDDQKTGERDLVDEMRHRLDPALGLNTCWLLVHKDDGDELLIVANHMVIDVSSWKSLIGEIAELLLGGRESLPAHAPSYAFWVEELYKNASGLTGNAAIDFWSAYFEAKSAVPARKVASHSTADKYASLEIYISEEIGSRLRSALRAYHGASLEGLFLYLIGQCVCKVSRENVTWFEVEGQGRELKSAMNFSDSIGWFTSLYPVAVEEYLVDPSTGLDKFFREMQEMAVHRVLYSAISGKLPQVVQPRFSYLYLGDEDIAEESPLQVLQNLAGEHMDENVSPFHELDFLLSWSRGRIKLSIGGRRSGVIYGAAAEILEEFKNIAASFAAKDKGLDSDMAELDLSESDMDAIMKEIES